MQRRFLSLTLFFVLLTLPLAAEDWPAWRGAAGDAVWTESGVLQTFPEGGLEIRWRTPVKEGYAGPAVRDGRVFVADWERSEDRSRFAGTERVLALDEATGAVLWTQQWKADYSAIMGSYAEGPRAVPTVDEERVYVMGAGGDLVAVNAHDGTLAWSRSYTDEYDAGVPIFGFSSSPMLYGETLIAIVGGEPDALVVALDRTTGAEVWRSIETVSEPGYSQPTLVEIDGVEQVLIWHPTALTALEPQTGAELWSFEYEAKDTLSVATPVVSGNRIFLTQFYGGAVMVEVENGPSGMVAKEVWRAKGESEMSGKTAALHSLITTPIFEGDTVYGIDSYGELRALDAASGERLWEDKTMTRQGRWGTAFSVRHGDRWVGLTDQGDVIFYRLDREAYQELDRAKLLEPTTSAGFGPRRHFDAQVIWGHPAFANRHIFARNDREVVSASLAAQSD